MSNERFVSLPSVAGVWRTRVGRLWARIIGIQKGVGQWVQDH